LREGKAKQKRNKWAQGSKPTNKEEKALEGRYEVEAGQKGKKAGWSRKLAVSPRPLRAPTKSSVRARNPQEHGSS
jgi:hypothetical protein